MTRLPGLPDEEWTPHVRELLDDAVARVGAVANPLPTLTLIARQEALLEPFLVWARAIGLGASLPRRTAELVALRTAHLCGSGFEWHEHAGYARAYGIADGEIDRIAAGPAAPGWADADRAALQAADDLHRTASVDDGTWAALARHFSPAEIVELVLVAGQYRMLSGLANAAGVDGEPGGARADADELLGLRDAVALVTGGAKSIGQGCAVLLGRAGCHVVVADLADATETVAEVEALGRQVLFERGDMRSKADVERIVDRTIERFGRLDVAVNTVGSTKGPQSFLDIDVADWDEVITQNLSTAAICMQVEALAMIKLGIAGRIVNVASLSGMAGAPNAAGYGAANAGVIHVTRSAAQELARYGIRVNCIVPGTHYTEAVHAAVARNPAMAEWVRRTAESSPLGRLGEVWETAGVAVFLASKLSSYVTGEEIVSDGGMLHTTARPPIGMDTEAEAVQRLRRQAT